jgi:DNA-binding helix-hairpin-helix protein with protein kinase domain
MLVQCARDSHHVWEGCTGETCPTCYRKARKRAANECGPGTSHDVAESRCIEQDRVAVPVRECAR